MILFAIITIVLLYLLTRIPGLLTLCSPLIVFLDLKYKENKKQNKIMYLAMLIVALFFTETLYFVHFILLLVLINSFTMRTTLLLTSKIRMKTRTLLYYIFIAAIWIHVESSLILEGNIDLIVKQSKQKFLLENSSELGKIISSSSIDLVSFINSAEFDGLIKTVFLPISIALSVIIFLRLSFIISAKISSKLSMGNYPIYHPLVFSHFRIGKSVNRMIAITYLILLYLKSELPDNGYYLMTYFNILLLISYTVQGLAVLSNKLKERLKESFFWKLTYYLTLTIMFSNVFTLALLCIVGFIDNFVDFRKIM